MSKYGQRNLDWFEALVNKLGGEDGVERFLRDELVLVERQAQTVPRQVNLAKLVAMAGSGDTVSTEDIEKCLELKWTIEDGVIYPTLPPTTGRTGEEWFAHFKQKGDRVDGYAKSVLFSKKFLPTTGVVNKIAVLPAKLWKDSDRLTKRIRKDACAGIFTKGQKLSDPNAEVSCLIRDYLTDEEIEALGLWYIVGMHEPIKDADGHPHLIGAHRHDDGRWLHAYYDDPDGQWSGHGGFAFSVPQVSSQN